MGLVLSGVDEASSSLLPEGSILVHIGPYKTGSTAIQLAMNEQRAELAEHGVLYPGTDWRQRRPGWGLVGRTPAGRPKATLADWEILVDEIRAAREPRICVSTEDLGAADAGQIARLVEDLGADRVHVITVIRGLDGLLPSQWQERVKTRPWIESYEEWLREVLDPEGDNASARTFWRSHDLGRVIRDWTAVLPPEQFIAVVGDKRNRRQVPDTFERLLGLSDGFLTPSSAANASLTRERTEFHRQLNQVFRDNKWSERDFLRFMRRGVLRQTMSIPAREDEQAGLPVPAWAGERVAQLSEERARVLEESGVTVIGDPGSLRVDPASFGGEIEPAPTTIPIEVAVAAVAAAIRVGRELAEKPAPAAPEAEPSRDLVRRMTGAVRRRRD